MNKALIIVSLTALLAFSLTVPAAAVERPEASQIPVGTLIIGTHLIYAPAMTSAVYETALLSPTDSSLYSQQNSVYYKSEFAGGQWVDISAATNIYDLSAVSGKIVDNSVIDALTLKFYTMSDGKTYDLTTGSQIAVADILSPYDANAQPEMEPLVNHLSALDAENKDNLFARAILIDILNSSYSDDYTNYLDNSIGKLNSALNEMSGRNAPVQSQEALSKLITKLDHRRRVRSLSAMRDKVFDGLSKAGEKDLQGLITTMSPVADALETQIQAHLAADGESGSMDAALAASGKEKIRSELESKLLLHLDTGGSASEADGLLQELANMDNLDRGAVISPEEELATALEIIDGLRDEFMEKLGAGAIDELAAANPEEPYALRAAEEKQAEVFESVRFELQAAIDAAAIRMNPQEYESLLSSFISEAREIPKNVKDDASKLTALASIQNYADWLDSEYRNAGEESVAKSEAQLLQIEINGLEQESKAALDKNDLALSDSLDREIADKVAKLSALEDDISAKLSALKASVGELEQDAELAALTGDTPLAESLKKQTSSLQSEINALEAALPTDVRAAQGEIARMKQDALKAVEQGETAIVTASIEGIAAFANREPAAALGAVGAISDAILRQKALFGAEGGNLDGAQEMISELLPDLRGKASDIGGADTQKLRGLCDSRLEPLPNDIPARIAAVLLLDGGKDDKNLLNLLDEYYTALQGGQGTTAGQGSVSGQIFTAVVNANARYVPAAILPHYVNLRFLPEKNSTCLLTNGAVYYRFTRGSVSVRSHTGSFNMKSTVYYSGNIAYLPESFVSEQFGLTVLEIPHRGTAILIDKVSRAKAEEIAAAMKGD